MADSEPETAQELMDATLEVPKGEVAHVDVGNDGDEDEDENCDDDDVAHSSVYVNDASSSLGDAVAEAFDDRITGQVDDGDSDDMEDDELDLEGDAEGVASDTLLTGSNNDNKLLLERTQQQPHGLFQSRENILAVATAAAAGNDRVKVNAVKFPTTNLPQPPEQLQEQSTGMFQGFPPNLMQQAGLVAAAMNPHLLATAAAALPLAQSNGSNINDMMTAVQQQRTSALQPAPAIAPILPLQIALALGLNPTLLQPIQQQQRPPVDMTSPSQPSSTNATQVQETPPLAPALNPIFPTQQPLQQQMQPPQWDPDAVLRAVLFLQNSALVAPGGGGNAGIPPQLLAAAFTPVVVSDNNVNNNATFLYPNHAMQQAASNTLSAHMVNNGATNNNDAKQLRGFDGVNSANHNNNTIAINNNNTFPTVNFPMSTLQQMIPMVAVSPPHLQQQQQLNLHQQQQTTAETVPVAAKTAHTSPQNRPERAAIPLYLDHDENCLTPYQCFLRKQIELFEAGEDELQGTAQGRNTPLHRGQLGIRCRHCAHLPKAARARGGVYYSKTIDGVYQVAQNMSKFHFLKSCSLIPDTTKNELLSLQNMSSRASGGKEYWAEGLRVLGVVEDKRGYLKFKARYSMSPSAQSKN